MGRRPGRTNDLNAVGDQGEHRSVTPPPPEESRCADAVVECGSLLANTPDLEDAMPRVVHVLRAATESDRAYVHWIKEDTAEEEGVCFETRWESSAEGVPRRTAEGSGLVLDRTGASGGLLDRLASGKPVAGPLDELSPTWRGLLAFGETRSVLILPVRWDGELLGLLGFDDRRQRRRSPREVGLLLVVASLIAATACASPRQTSTAVGERRRLADELRRSETLLSQAAEVAELGVWEMDIPSRWVSMSNELMRMYHLERASCTIDEILTMVHPEDHAKVKEAWEEASSRGGAYSVRHRIIRQDTGEVRHLRTRGVVVSDEDGKPLRMYGASHDVTDRLGAARKLRETVDFLQTLIDAIPAPLFYKNAAGVYQGCNSAFTQEVLGLPKDKVLGHTLFDLPRTLPPDLAELHHRQDVELLRKGGTLVYECEVLCADDVRRTYSLHKATFNDPVGRVAGIVGVMVDLTGHIEAERLLQQHRQRLRALASRSVLAEERARRRIARGLHDGVGQVLTLICLQLERLRQAGLPASLTSEVSEIQTLAADALEQTRTLTFEISPPVLYEMGLAAAVKWEARNLTSRHGTPVQVHDHGIGADLPDDLAVLLYQSTRELLNNAVKHSQASRITVDLRPRADVIEIVIADDGVGFDPEEAARRSVLTRSYGLFSIRERLQNLGGEMTIRSAPEEGTAFKLSVPRTGDAQKEAGGEG